MSIWHCSNMLLWLLRRCWLHRSAWKSFKQSIWDRMQHSLVNLRPGKSIWTSYVENVCLFFPTLGIWKKHKKNIALTPVQAMTVAPAENRSQTVCSGNSLKAGRALCTQVAGGCTKRETHWRVQVSSAASAQIRNNSDVDGADCKSSPQQDTCTNIWGLNFVTIGRWKGLE